MQIKHMMFVMMLVPMACAHRTAPMGQRLLPGNQGRVLDVGLKDPPPGSPAPSCTPLTYTEASWQARFVGANIAVKLRCAAPSQQCMGPLTVEVDGVARAPVPAPGPETRWVALATELAPGPHTVIVRRTAEAQLGAVELCAVAAEGGRLLPPPPPSPRQMLVLGDSISAGFGNLCPGLEGFDAMALEDGGKTYGALAARALGAEVRIMAWSGIGLWRNGDGSFDDTLPKRWDALWGPKSAPQAHLDAIVINLGTNDFRRDNVDDAAFVASYGRFVRVLHRSYPKAHFFLAVGPMLSDTDPQNNPQQPHARRLVAQVAADVIAKDTSLKGRLHAITFVTQDGGLGYGCAYHPNLATHAQMATTLRRALQNALGWSCF